MMTLNPYLVFKDNCEEAFNFYKVIFGGNILFMGRYKDVPQGDKQWFPMAQDEKIMHATLQLNAETLLMGCDSLETHEQSKTVFLNNFYLYISTDNEEEAYRIFNGLAVGGKIIMPITQTFWSTHYGMLADKFGIYWKITFNPNKQ
ncbi:VOC family protein [Mucilaginibacter arboris]|uniref:VOC family protein n=1 Tax=Mucilaginibacter arboris TaxID=2682090 RepID=A0A7K1SYH9_9SPHI|nr:VOC family protein [Mucilaginibacter arboris]MVN22375.1 VOC family protein [Mucilaginibacter arboris]